MSDKEILELFHTQTGKETAFTQLMSKYQEKLYWMIRRMVNSHDDTDDILQNVFIKIWRGLEKFRADSQLYTWIYRIATNETITYIKKNKKHQQTVSMYASTDQEGEQSIFDNIKSDTFIDGDDIEKRLQKAINQLPPKQKLVFEMRYYQEMKYEDISEVVGTSVGALKASYFHAAKKIEELVFKL